MCLMSSSCGQSNTPSIGLSSITTQANRMRWHCVRIVRHVCERETRLFISAIPGDFSSSPTMPAQTSDGRLRQRTMISECEGREDRDSKQYEKERYKVKTSSAPRPISTESDRTLL